MGAVNLLAACLLDRVLGDPRWIPHPVRMMGALISWCDGLGRKLFSTPHRQRRMGIFIAVFVPGMSYAASWWVLEFTANVHLWLTNVIWVLLAYTTLAAKDLASHAWKVYCFLLAGSLPEARKAVSLIVGRDTEQLSESEVSRATIETVAESTSDGIIAPLFYLVLGGPPLALAYKAINTLDSMIGHKEEPYRDIGWASAKLDDVANWIPARLSAVIFVIAAWIQYKTLGQAWKIYRQDCAKHESPNSGHPEAAMAGALGIQLGGPNFYDGICVNRDPIGDAANPPHPEHIPPALDLMWMSFWIATFMGVAVMVLWKIL